MWTGNATSINVASPLVWNGTVYAGSTNGTLYAFDAAGVTNCSGTPKTCAPVWTATTGDSIYAPPAAANGVLYVGTLGDTTSLYAFDAAGITNCSGTPKTCTPLWRGNRPFGVRSAPAIAHGVVYVGDTSITAFDAAGITNCTGTPTICSPLWDTPALNAEFNGPAVAGGVVYGSYFAGHLYTFDAGGTEARAGVGSEVRLGVGGGRRLRDRLAGEARLGLQTAFAGEPLVDRLAPEDHCGSISP